MKYIPIILLTWGSLAFAQEPTWKTGDPVLPSDLPEGVVYEGATLSRVEPDSITIMHSAGVAKIPLANLSPEAQTKFGYDPAKAEFYTKEREYLGKIARLKAHVADLQNKLATQDVAPQKSKTTARTEAAPQPTQAGFNAFIEEQRNLSGGRRMSGSDRKAGAVYIQGPWKGKTEGEGIEFSRRQWEAMSYQNKIAYEQRAGNYGSMEQYRKPTPPSSSSSLQDKQFIQSGNGWMSTDGTIHIDIVGGQLRIRSN